MIEQLFANGKSNSAFPLKMLYTFVENGEPELLKAGFAASSRKFKRAADRNRIKRLMKEAYRLQKLPMEDALRQQAKKAAVFFIYLGKELPAYGEVYQKMGQLIQRLQKEINHNPSKD